MPMNKFGILHLKAAIRTLQSWAPPLTYTIISLCKQILNEQIASQTQQ